MAHFGPVIHTASGTLASSGVQQEPSNTSPPLSAKQQRLSRPNTKEEIRNMKRKRKERIRKEIGRKSKQERMHNASHIRRKIEQKIVFLDQELQDQANYAIEQRKTALCFWRKWKEERSKNEITKWQVRQRSRIYYDSDITKVDQTTELDFSVIDRATRYKILCSSILPRPIALVSSCSRDGLIPNLANFSFFMPVTSDPPTLAFSITRKNNHKKKDTLVNIEETGHFVVNHLPHYIFDKAYQASKEFPSEVNEFEVVGLTPTPSKCGISPCVLESPISLECKLHKLVHVGSDRYGASTIVIGEVVYSHFRGVLYKDGKVDTTSLQSVSRLDGMNYGNAGISFTVKNNEVWSYKHW